MFHDLITHLTRCLGSLTARQKRVNRLPRRGSLLSASGSLFIEAAIIMPVALAGFMGAVEVLNIQVQRGSVMNAAHSIAMAIQQNPQITAQEMDEFQKSLGGGLTRIGASTTPIKESTVGNSNSWSNPWLSDGDPANDRNPYYVWVHLEWMVKPLFASFLSSGFKVRQFTTVVVKATPALQMTTWSQAFCGVTETFIPNSDGNTVCALTAVDDDANRPIYGGGSYKCQLLNRGYGWTYKAVLGCGEVGCMYTCWKFSLG